MEIPQAFLEDMRSLLGKNYSAFERAFFSQPPVRGLRVNTLKLTPEAFSSISPYPLTPSPLCRDSFLLDSDARVGLHPFHHAGLFYMQEPSASAVVEALDPSPGTMVLDLCAAPGGKSHTSWPRVWQETAFWLRTNVLHRVYSRCVPISNESAHEMLWSHPLCRMCLRRHLTRASTPWS